MSFKSQSNAFRNEKNSSILSLLPFHKKIVPVSSKEKNSLKLSACPCSINRSNLLIAISKYEQEFGAPVAVQFVCKRWFSSN